MHPVIILRLVTWAIKGAVAFVLGLPLVVLAVGRANAEKKMVQSNNVTGTCAGRDVYPGRDLAGVANPPRADTTARNLAANVVAMGAGLAVVLLLVGLAGGGRVLAAEVTRVQAESVTSAIGSNLYLPTASPDVDPNAQRINSNGTVNYSVSVPANTTVDKVVVRSRSALTSTGSVTLNVVVDGVAQTAKSIPASAQPFSDRTWTLAAPLQPGGHTIGLRAGNTTTANRVVNDYFYLNGTGGTPQDTTPPETTITGGPANGSTQPKDATFTFASSEANSTFQCKLDAGAYEACYSGTKSYSNLAQGSHTFSVKAKDAAGNEDVSPASRTWTVSGEQLPSHTAKTSQAFVNSIGIVAHLKDVTTVYGTDYANIKAYLAELGVKHARDALVKTSSTTVYNRWAELYANHGIKFDLTVNENIFPTPPSTATLEQAVANADGAVESFEGPNEYNNDHQTEPGWEQDLRAYQCAVFNNLNASGSSVANIPMLAAALGKPGGEYPVATPKLGDCSDLNNIHAYSGGNHPTGSHVTAYDSLWFDRDVPKGNQIGVAGRDMMMTEAGYSNADDSEGYTSGVSQEAHKRYAPRLSFECFNAYDRADEPAANLVRCYHYQLRDHRNNGPGNPQSHFGLVDYNGVKKPAFRALENTIDILEDPGTTFATSSLAYTLANTTPDIHQTLLQKRDGTFYLALWQEVRSYDKRTDQMITVTPQQVTVQFSGAMKTVKVFDPTNIASSGPADEAETHPSRTLSSVSSVTEPIGDQVKIIQVTKP